MAKTINVFCATSMLCVFL